MLGSLTERKTDLIAARGVFLFSFFFFFVRCGGLHPLEEEGGVSP